MSPTQILRPEVIDPYISSEGIQFDDFMCNLERYLRIPEEISSPDFVELTSDIHDSLVDRLVKEEESFDKQVIWCYSLVLALAELTDGYTRINSEFIPMMSNAVIRYDLSRRLIPSVFSGILAPGLSRRVRKAFKHLSDLGEV